MLVPIRSSRRAGEEEKKKGSRKVLFKKPPGIAVGTSKMRLVQAVLSPRKNGSTKSGKHQGGGEGAKQTEEKGPLNPKNSSAKPLN
ncbi:BnaA05g16160D [Brassica napus]|uniref:BnaA05g16160D protein n=2 Tax=Brassica TaxID=3705 RepID=A0A078GW07_BRANA|nr:BnaA05g16160D [Brassica napus]